MSSTPGPSQPAYLVMGNGSFLPATFHSLRFFLFTVAIGLGFSIIYVATDLYLYFDGGLFSFVVATGHPYDLLLCNFPARSGAFLLSVVPASLFERLTGNGPAAIHLWAILFICWPTVGAILTRALDKTPDKHISSYCNVCTLTTPLYTLGFPTKIWIAFGLFWPALCCACVRPSTRRLAVLLALLALLAFTHEAAMLLWAVAAGAALWCYDGWRRVVLLIGIVTIALSWLLVKTQAPGCFAWQPPAANVLLDLMKPNPVLKEIIAGMAGWLAGMSIAKTLKWKTSTAHIFALSVGALLTVGYLWISFDHILIKERYLSRMLVVTQTLIFAAACLISLLIVAQKQTFRVVPLLDSIKDQLLLGTPQLRDAAFAFVIFSVTAHVYATIRFLDPWLELNREVAGIIDGAPAPVGYEVLSLDNGRVTSSTGSVERSKAWSVESGGITALMVLRAPNFDAKRLIVTRLTGFMTFDCSYGDIIARNPGSIGPNRIALLRHILCEPS